MLALMFHRKHEVLELSSSPNIGNDVLLGEQGHSAHSGVMHIVFQCSPDGGLREHYNNSHSERGV